MNIYGDTTVYRTITNYPDTSFSVYEIDPITISVGLDALPYYHSSDSLLIFRRSYSDQPAYPFDYDEVYFSYVLNKVHFQMYRRLGAGGDSYEDYTTP